MSQENHQKIRNLIAMILLPKTLHKNDESQAACLRAAVSRVSLVLNYFCVTQIVIGIQEFEFIDCFSDCEPNSS